MPFSSSMATTLRVGRARAARAAASGGSRGAELRGDVAGELLHDLAGLAVHHRLAELTELAEDSGVGMDRHRGGAGDARHVHGELPDPFGRRADDELLLDDHAFALLGPLPYTTVP